MVAKKVTKTIKGKVYDLYDYFKSEPEAKAKAKSLDGRLHIFTGLITTTEITTIPQKGKTPPIYAVWTRKLGKNEKHPRFE